MSNCDMASYHAAIKDLSSGSLKRVAVTELVNILPGKRYKPFLPKTFQDFSSRSLYGRVKRHSDGVTRVSRIKILHLRPTAEDINEMLKKNEVKNPPSKKFPSELLSEYVLSEEKLSAKSSKKKNNLPSRSDNTKIIDQFNKQKAKEATSEEEVSKRASQDATTSSPVVTEDLMHIKRRNSTLSESEDPAANTSSGNADSWCNFETQVLNEDNFVQSGKSSGIAVEESGISSTADKLAKKNNLPSRSNITKIIDQFQKQKAKKATSKEEVSKRSDATKRTSPVTEALLIKKRRTLSESEDPAANTTSRNADSWCNFETQVLNEDNFVQSGKSSGIAVEESGISSTADKLAKKNNLPSRSDITKIIDQFQKQKAKKATSEEEVSKRASQDATTSSPVVTEDLMHIKRRNSTISESEDPAANTTSRNADSWCNFEKQVLNEDNFVQSGKNVSSTADKLALSDYESEDNCLKNPDPIPDNLAAHLASDDDENMESTKETGSSFLVAHIPFPTDSCNLSNIAAKPIRSNKNQSGENIFYKESLDPREFIACEMAADLQPMQTSKCCCNNQILTEVQSMRQELKELKDLIQGGEVSVPQQQISSRQQHDGLWPISNAVEPSRMAPEGTPPTLVYCGEQAKCLARKAIEQVILYDDYTVRYKVTSLLDIMFPKGIDHFWLRKTKADTGKILFPEDSKHALKNLINIGFKVTACDKIYAQEVTLHDISVHLSKAFSDSRAGNKSAETST